MQWSPEDIALLDQSEEMQCDITRFSFCDVKVGKVVIGSMLGHRGGYWSSVGLV